ncbi:hypothetical protein A4A49_09050 [Nicotiana attenuata]|uniref:Uncharacterized protein n=1 Tax=Nicotiana attenuata TaxID=49451 RepID=A0A314KYL6_NICAT|nr:hypothetical protein A4A49_09050 [Nicotiana attenuata]
MIQKLSTRMPSLEHRTKVLKEIASENNIVLQIAEAVLETTEVVKTIQGLLPHKKIDSKLKHPNNHEIFAPKVQETMCSYKK